MAIENLGLEIRILSNLIYDKANKVTMSEENLSFHQASILQYLKENRDKEIVQKDIEHLFSIKRSTANQMLKSLEARQLIKRVTSPKDARKNILIITDEGLKTYDHLASHLHEVVVKLHGDLSEEDLASFKKHYVNYGVTSNSLRFLFS